MNSTEINCNGEILQLSVHRVAFWEKHRMLIASDTHLGKSAYFRKNGIQIPSGVLTADLRRLQSLTESFNAKTILVVGDMFHHDFNSDVEVFKNWKQNFPHIRFILVKGNHDRLSQKQYAHLGIEVFEDGLQVDNLYFTHAFTCANADGFCITGHVHPGVYIQGKANQAIRLPCFVESADHLVLPAYSSFTGLDTNTYQQKAGVRFHYFTEKSIFSTR